MPKAEPNPIWEQVIIKGGEMNFTEKELKKELEAYAYAWGYCLFGPKAGGRITELLRRKGLRAARAVLKACHLSADPSDYLGGVMREVVEKMKDEMHVGHIMGRYCYDGKKMVDGRDCAKGRRIGDSEWDGNKWSEKPSDQ